MTIVGARTRGLNGVRWPRFPNWNRLAWRVWRRFVVPPLRVADGFRVPNVGSPFGSALPLASTNSGIDFLPVSVS